MSTKPDYIDLNSDSSLFDRENDVHGVDISEDRPGDGGCLTETLKDPLDGLGQVPDVPGDEVRDFLGATGFVDLISGSTFGRVVDNVKSEVLIDVERKMESVNGGTGAETEVGSASQEINKKTCSHDANEESLVGAELDLNIERQEEGMSMRDEEDMVISQAPEIASGKIKEKLKENATTVSGNALQPAKNGALGSLSVDLKPTCLVADADECGEVSKDGNSVGLEEKVMETDSVVENEVMRLEVGFPQNAKIVSSELKLVVDLDPYMSRDEHVAEEVNLKSSVSKPEICFSDLVWGKVRSHPWWPGQVVDPSVSSEKAKKYFRKDSYLIAYFGDHTFAWNDVSRIKPFRTPFAQMVSQSSSEDFHHAIDCALDEVSRRIEFGLACSCISKQVYNKIKTQVIVNAGIQKESSNRDGGDRFSSIASFEPAKLVGCMKNLACFPCYFGANRLELVTLQAQLLAFHRWKGYYQLPEFQMLGELSESEEEISLSGETKICFQVTENAVMELKPDEQLSSGNGKSSSRDSTCHKRKHILGSSTQPRKKEKSLSELIADRRLSNNGGRLTNKAGGKLTSPSSGKKRKADDSSSDDSVMKQRKIFLSKESAHDSQKLKQAFRVGASILRVASQLNGSNPILKNHSDGSSQKTAVKNKGNEKSLCGKSQCKSLIPSDDSSLDEMLLQLHSVATDPMKKYSFLKSFVSFFSDFRNSVSLEDSSSAKIGEKLTKSENIERTEWSDMEDSNLPSRVSQCLAEEQVWHENQSGAVELPWLLNKETLHSNESNLISVHNNSFSEQQSAGGNSQSDAMQSVGPSEVSCKEDVHETDISPTALILNFKDLDFIPSEANLSKIFSRYGELNESQTEVLKKSKRAKVVFRRRADAETAFSSAGKYSIFGPSLVSYCLKYSSSKSTTASPNAKMPRNKDRACNDGNAA